MSVIVTDAGFVEDRFSGEPVAPEALAGHSGNGTVIVDLAATADPLPLVAHFARIDLIRVTFAAFNDGRGFTLAARLRRLGYAGHLRAQGHVIADQYAMARRAGFDDVGIDADLALRQPAAQWAFRADWRAHDYQTRMRGPAPDAADTSLAAE